jgi:uncharacterized membrane protein
LDIVPPKSNHHNSPSASPNNTTITPQSTVFLQNSPSFHQSTQTITSSPKHPITQSIKMRFAVIATLFAAAAVAAPTSNVAVSKRSPMQSVADSASAAMKAQEDGGCSVPGQ